MLKKVSIAFLILIISMASFAKIDQIKLRLKDALWNLQNIDPDYVAEQLDLAAVFLESDDWQTFQKGEDILERLEFQFIDTRIAETRCVWIDYVTFGDFYDRSHIGQVLDMYEDIGIHIVFPEVYAYGTTIYPSDVAKIQDQYLYLWTEGDILEIFIEEAHKRGMEVHPLVRIFTSGTKTPGHLIKQYPTWLEVTRDGTRGDANSWFVSPVIPEFRRFLEAVMTELVTNYNIDGLHLDYIRYEQGDFGYSDASRDLYKRIFFQDPLDFTPGSAEEEAFKEFRRAQVDAFVRWCYTDLKKIKPDLYLSAAVGSPYSWDYSSLYQDWVYWSKMGYIDFVTSMQYRDTTPKLRTAINEDMAANTEWLPLFSGLGLYLYINQPRELESQIIEVRNNNLPGIALFSDANLTIFKYMRIKDGVFREKAVPVHGDTQKAIEVYLDDLVKRILKNGSYLGLDQGLLQELAMDIKETKGYCVIESAEYPNLAKVINERLKYVEALRRYYKIND